MRHRWLLILTIYVPSVAAAQDIREPRATIWLQVLKAHFPVNSIAILSYLDGAQLTTAVTLGGRYRMTSTLEVVAELPFSHVNGKTNGCVDAVCITKVTETVINNPYVGIDWQTPLSAVGLAVGVRFPAQTANWDESNGDWERIWEGWATETGVYADAIDRLEAYLPDVTSGTFALWFRSSPLAGIQLEAFLRPILLYHPTASGYVHDRDDEKYERHLHYGARASFAFGPGSIGGGVHGRSRPTERSLPDHDFYQADIMGALQLGSLRAFGQYRRPFGHEYSRLWVDGSFVVGLEASF